MKYADEMVEIDALQRVLFGGRRVTSAAPDVVGFAVNTLVRWRNVSVGQ